MNAKFVFSLCAAGLIASVLIGACSAPTAAPQIIVQTQMVEVREAYMATPVPYPSPIRGSGGGATNEGGASAEDKASDSSALPAATGMAPGSPDQLAFVPAGSGMVIKDAEFELLVADTSQALNKATQKTADYGGYIISSQTWYQGEYLYAMLKLGIPSGNFEASLTYFRGLAVQVIREVATGQDVSAAYTDLQSQLINLEATAARVREFLADAKTVEESLRISGELSTLEAQIETIKGQMRYYEGRAAFSTVTLYLTPLFPTPTATLTPTPTNTPTPTPTFTPTPTATVWSPGETFGEASGVLVNVTQNLVDTLIWIGVVGGPFLLLLGLLFWAGRKVVKK
jgi:hypothetical protein